MRILIALAILALVYAEQMEFYNFDQVLADPCVNQQRLDRLQQRWDCAPNTMQPGASNTLLIGDNTPLATLQSLTLTIAGKFFPGTGAAGSNGFISFSRSSTCGPAIDFSGITLIGAMPVDGTSTVMRLQAATWAQLFTTWTSAGVANAPGTVQVNPAPSTFTELQYVPADPAIGIDEPNARHVCWSAAAAGPWQWTGFRIAVVFNCEIDTSVNTLRWCKNKPVRFTDTESSKAVYRAQTTCCMINTAQIKTRNLQVSQCINPNTQNCCGTSAVVNGFQKCCNETVNTVAWADGTCSCTRGNAAFSCPYNETCCLPNKYPELMVNSDAAGNPLATDLNRIGECYNPRYYRCCDTGRKYDPGSEQCCVINGLQSVNVPCPCAQTSDCYGSQQNGYQFRDFDCCIQNAPQRMELGVRGTVQTCTKYQNYPSGTGAANVQQCIGQCFDTKYQVCCNGRTCIRQFERCCNTTCCNRYNGTCQSGTLREGSSRNNFIDVGIAYDVCTIVEQIDLIRAWWMFVLPTFLLMATLTSLAIALVFAGRVEHAARRGLEKGMITAGIICVMFACCTFFAPIYKYGVVIVFISLFAIITAAARKINMYIACIILQILLLIYLIDPFHGNDYFNLAVDRNAFGRADPYSAGLWHTTTRIWDVPSTCWDFYSGYFKFDPLIRDNVRIDEPNNPSFGYCSRGWVSALLVFDGFIIIAVLAQFVLDIIVLLIRARMMMKEIDVNWTP